MSGVDGRREFSFQPGPIFCHILLGDEINRATPKTQSALLEAMAELQVTVSGYDLSAEAAVFRDGDAQPDRNGRHLSAARGPTRSLPVQGAARPIPGEAELGAHHRFDHPGRRKPASSRYSSPPRPRNASRGLKRLVREVLVAPPIEQYAARLVRATQPANSRVIGDLHSPIVVGRGNGESLRQASARSPRGALALDSRRQSARDARRSRQYLLRRYRSRSHRPPSNIASCSTTPRIPITSMPNISSSRSSRAARTSRV